MIRVAVLWSHISGYLSASLQALKNRGCEIFLSAYAPQGNAPFEKDIFSWLPEGNKSWWPKGAVNGEELTQALVTFHPDIILCSGWSNPAYLSASKYFREKALRVLCFDTPWQNSLRQSLGRVWSRLKLLPNFERVFVPGERQFQTAVMLGFKPRNVIFGMLAPDTVRFTPKQFPDCTDNKRFIYVGRISKEKGVHELARAYQDYRSQTELPWPLVVAGTGPLENVLVQQPGVEILGFVQPRDLPPLLFQAGCMVAPSLYEPWGVQISEGVTAGLPVIATHSCGASTHLVRSNFNGYLVEAGDVHGLTQAMVSIGRNKDLSVFSHNSQLLSRQFTPELFAMNLLESCAPLFDAKGTRSGQVLWQ